VNNSNEIDSYFVEKLKETITFDKLIGIRQLIH